MRSLFICLISLFSLNLMAQQELTLTPTITKATVYRTGAKLTATQKAYLNKGKAILVFENLSPNIDKNSIRIKGLKGVKLNYFTYETDFLKSKNESQELESLNTTAASLNRQIAIKNNKINAYNKAIQLLEKNQELNNTSNELTVAKVNTYAEYYRNKIEDINTTVYDLEVEKDKLNKELTDVNQEIRKLKNKNQKSRGKITFDLDVTQASQKNFEIDYFIYDAGWFATYDLSAKSIKDKMNLAYKAKVYQASGRDWSELKLSLSTADPRKDNSMPELSPLYVNYRSTFRNTGSLAYNFNHLSYNRGVQNVSGIIYDSNGLPLPGVNVMVGSNGTQTDFEGRYNISTNGNSKYIVFKYLGFKTAQVPIYSSTITLNLKEDRSSLDEVVVTAYSALKSKANGIQVENDNEIVEVEETPETTDEGNSFSFTFPAEVSLASSLKNSNFDINNFDLDTKYEYYISSEYSSAAYLIANIKDWQDLDLINGDAKIYFNESYIGNTAINVNTTKEDLVISLGIDDQVIVKRNDVKQKKTSSFFGSNKIISKSYEVEIKNNKNTGISVLVEERAPISRQEDIKVDELEYNADKFDQKTGYLQWKFDLKPSENKTLNYSFEIKHPKNKPINIQD